jgi:hypothetical protein
MIFRKAFLELGRPLVREDGLSADEEREAARGADPSFAKMGCTWGDFLV